MTEMDDPVFQLCAAITLSGIHDGILIPVYSCYPRNENFIAATNNRMSIVSFQELEVLLAYIRPADIDCCPKTQFVKGDLSPVMMQIDGCLRTVQGDSVDHIIDLLLSMDICDSEIVHDVINSLKLSNYIPHEMPYSEDMRWADLTDTDVDPKPARLWLDLAVEQLDERHGEPDDIEEIKSRTRIQLLSWAAKIAEGATSPIFRHFLWTAKKIERRGVYVQDILGAAIVNWVYQDIGQMEWLVDIIRDFRRSYGRGPLTSVIELANHQVPTLADWADQTLARYHNHIRKIVDTAWPYELLAMTFVGDDGTHWPPDLREKLIGRVGLHEKELRTLLEERREIIERLELGQKPRSKRAVDRPYLYRRLRSLATSIKSVAAILDSLRKSLSDSPEYREYTRRFEGIDYSALGLSREFFIDLERSIDTLHGNAV